MESKGVSSDQAINTQGVGAAIKARREYLGLTQEVLAARLGRHPQMVHRYESGKADVSWEMLQRIALALETTPGDLTARGASRVSEGGESQYVGADRSAYAFDERTPGVISSGSLGKAIRERREELNLRQQDLADTLGMHLQSVNRIENGHTSVDLERLTQIGEALSTTLNALVSRADHIYAGNNAAAANAQSNLADVAAREKFAALEYLRNAAFKPRLPPRLYERVYSYVDRLLEKGATKEQIDEAERLMAVSAYTRLDPRDVRERSEDDMLLDVDDAWIYITSVPTRRGLTGLRNTEDETALRGARVMEFKDASPAAEREKEAGKKKKKLKGA